MEELIDFLIDVFGNVWRKFKINAFLVLTGGILSSLLFMPYMLKILPVYSLKYIFLRFLAAAFCSADFSKAVISGCQLSNC